MKKRIIKIAALAVVLLMAVSMISCGSAGYTDPELPEGYVVKPEGKIKITTYLRSGNQSEIALDKWISVYKEKYPDVTIKKEIIAWSDIFIQAAAGDIGDLYYSACGDVYNYAIKNKAAMPLDSYVENLNIDVENVYSSIYDKGCCNGALYLVPSDITQTTLQVNVSLLEQEGLSLPSQDWTWDDFIDYCKKIRKQNEDGTYAQIGFYNGDGGAVPALIYFMTGWGGKWIDTVNKKVKLFSDEKVLEGVTQYVDLIRNGYGYQYGMAGEGAAPFANLQYPQNDAFELQILWQSRVHYHDSFKELGLKYDAVTLPKTPVRTIPGDTFGYLVYSKTKNPDAAATFALSLFSYEGQLAFNSVLGGGVPTRQDVLAEGKWRIPFEESEFNYDAFTVYPESFVACWFECYAPPEISEILNDQLGTMIMKHFANMKDYKDVLAETEQRCNEVWQTLFDE